MRRHGSWRSRSWNMPNTNYSYTVIFIECILTLVCPSVHITSIASVHPGEGSSSIALLKVSSIFSLWKFFFYFLGVFPDPMWGFGTGMSICTDCKALRDKFAICENGLNWIDKLYTSLLFMAVAKASDTLGCWVSVPSMDISTVLLTRNSILYNIYIYTRTSQHNGLNPA